MSGEEMVTMSESQFELAKEVAVHGKQLEILIEDYQKSRDLMIDSMEKLGHGINEIPKMISDCKEELEDDIMDSTSSKYVTHEELNSIKNKILGATFMVGMLLGLLNLVLKLGWL